jgi:hypothetical protein
MVAEARARTVWAGIYGRGTVPPSLTAEDLKDLGVNLVGHRRRLLDTTAALANGAQDIAATPASREAPIQPDAERRQLRVMSDGG